MLEYLWDPFVDYGFMRRALLGCVSLSLGMAPVGLFLVLRKMGLAVDAVSHTIFPGVAIAYRLYGFSTLMMGIGGFVTGILVVFLTTCAVRISVLREESSLAAWHVIALASGIVIVAGGENSLDLLNFLVGNVLALDDMTLTVMVLGSCVSLLMVSCMYRVLLLDSMDPGYLTLLGFSVVLVRGLFLSIVVLNLVSGFLALGPLMVGGLMILPAVCSRLLFSGFRGQLVGSVLVSLLSGYLGLLMSFYWDVPSSAMVILVAGFLYISVLGVMVFRRYVLFV
jgi:zinc/manganese transport system permease protein